jgi:hypothetical protein
MDIRCVVCGKKPAELDEYSPESTGENLSAEDFVRQGEGTFNPDNGHFYCTPDYIKAGMPLGVAP